MPAADGDEFRTHHSDSKPSLCSHHSQGVSRGALFTIGSSNLSQGFQSGGSEIKNRTFYARSGILADNACTARPHNRQRGSPARLHSLYKQLFILLSLFETDYEAEDFWKNLFHLTTIFGNIRYRIEMCLLVFVCLPPEGCKWGERCSQCNFGKRLRLSGQEGLRCKAKAITWGCLWAMHCKTELTFL